jgi:hypothetical protein
MHERKESPLFFTLPYQLEALISTRCPGADSFHASATLWSTVVAVHQDETIYRRVLGECRRERFLHEKRPRHEDWIGEMKSYIAKVLEATRGMQYEEVVRSLCDLRHELLRAVTDMADSICAASRNFRALRASKYTGI